MSDIKNSANKKDLINELALRAEISKTQATKLIDMFTNIISDALVDGKKVTLSDFGTFNLSTRKAFRGYDPKNEEFIEIPSRTIPVFKAGKKMKLHLNIPSIRSCKIVSTKQIAVEIMGVQEAYKQEVEQVGNYSVVLTDGTKCGITSISCVNKEKSTVVTLQLKNEININGFTVYAHIPYVNMKNEVSKEPLTWDVQ